MLSIDLPFHSHLVINPVTVPRLNRRRRTSIAYSSNLTLSHKAKLFRRWNLSNPSLNGQVRTLAGYLRRSSQQRCPSVSTPLKSRSRRHLGSNVIKGYNALPLSWSPLVTLANNGPFLKIFSLIIRHFFRNRLMGIFQKLTQSPSFLETSIPVSSNFSYGGSIWGSLNTAKPLNMHLYVLKHGS